MSEELFSAAVAGSRKPHVCVVAWGFPPSRASGVYRGLAIANEFIAAGAEVTVLTATDDFFKLVTGTDPSLLEHVDPRAEIVRIPYFSAATDPVVSRWPEERVSKPRAWKRDELQRERSFFMEEGAYGAWRPALEQAALEVHRRKPVSLAVATGNPYTSYAALGYLHTLFGVPYVLDDRDGWLLDVYTGEERVRPGVAEWLEALIAGAVECWYVNPPIVRWHQGRFPAVAERIHVVENGWDRHLMDPDRTRRESGWPLRLGYIGTINAGFPLDLVVQAWRHARMEGLDESAELHMFGHLGYQRSTPEHARLLAQAEQWGVIFRGPVEKARIHAAYRELDALLFIREGGQMITAGKIYEYLATGKPVAVAADPMQDSRRVTSGYPRAFHASDGGMSEVARVMRQALEAARPYDREAEDAGQAYGARWERRSSLAPAVRRVLAEIQTPGEAHD